MAFWKEGLWKAGLWKAGFWKGMGDSVTPEPEETAAIAKVYFTIRESKTELRIL